MGQAGKWGSAVAVALFAVGQPAQACWTSGEENAAKIANLNMMMMVTALRCRKGQDNFLAEYNAFVRNNNGVIGAQNAAVRSHFARIKGAAHADAAMDHYVIGIANSYGGGHPTMGCQELKTVAKDLSAPRHDTASLLSIANLAIGDTALVGGRCTATIASR